MSEASARIFIDGIRHIDHAFPGESDPDRFEAIAFWLRLAADRQMRHAEMLRELHATTRGQ